jgi:hypothetical protein
VLSGRALARRHIGIDLPEEGVERVGEALDMAGWQARRRGARAGSSARIALQDLVRRIAVPDPQVVGRSESQAAPARDPRSPTGGVLAAQADLAGRQSPARRLA